MELTRIVFKFLALCLLTFAASTQGWAEDTVKQWRCSSPLQNISIVTKETPSTENILSSKIDVYPHELFRPVLTFLSSHTIYAAQSKIKKEYLTYELSYALEPDVVIETYLPETGTFLTETKPAVTYSTVVTCEEVEGATGI